MENNLYNLAQQEIEEEQSGDVRVLAFKHKYKLESGFYKKPVAFFHWLYQKENTRISLNLFKSAFIGRMVKFDKKNIPNYTELVFEYEKGKRAGNRQKATKARKAKIERLSQTRQGEID